ncbi:MAG: hypothetical protein N4A44_00500 [Alphaproteobacteria bacterium]|jgi:S-adenosylmethionine hydrolase|nr:hypothetical protein [Alphaproteobacteria bacterium]
MKEIFLVLLESLSINFERVSKENKNEFIFELFSEKEKVVEILITITANFDLAQHYKFKNSFQKVLWRFDGFGNVIINIPNGIDEKEISKEWSIEGKNNSLDNLNLKCFSGFNRECEMKVKIKSSFMKKEEPRMKLKILAS